MTEFVEHTDFKREELQIRSFILTMYSYGDVYVSLEGSIRELVQENSRAGVVKGKIFEIEENGGQSYFEHAKISWTLNSVD